MMSLPIGPSSLHTVRSLHAADPFSLDRLGDAFRKFIKAGICNVDRTYKDTCTFGIIPFPKTGFGFIVAFKTFTELCCGHSEQ